MRTLLEDAVGLRGGGVGPENANGQIGSPTWPRLDEVLLS